MSNGKSVILQRVREALRAPTDAHVRKSQGLPIVEAGSGANFQQWLPPVGGAYEDRRALFAELSEKLRTQFICVTDQQAACDVAARIAREESWRRAAYHGTGMAAELANAVQCEVMATDIGYDVADLEQCDAGITECEALIAQTGSVLITTTAAGGRALSVLPPHHVVIARRDQLLSNLSEGFALLRKRYANDWPSFSSLITGPSRTGDIERILVLGAHGPKRLTVLLVEN